MVLAWHFDIPCNRISAQVWNDCLGLAKEHFQQTGNWINRGMLHLATPLSYDENSVFVLIS